MSWTVEFIHTVAETDIACIETTRIQTESSRELFIFEILAAICPVAKNEIEIFRKYRSHSFSGVPKRKNSAIAGSAKVRAIYSRNNSLREKNNGKKSVQHSASVDQLKAVSDYYDRHPLSLCDGTFALLHYVCILAFSFTQQH